MGAAVRRPLDKGKACTDPAQAHSVQRLLIEQKMLKV